MTPAQRVEPYLARIYGFYDPLWQVPPRKSVEKVKGMDYPVHDPRPAGIERDEPGVE